MINLKNCSIEKFTAYAKDRKIYAFGASEYMRSLYERLPSGQYDFIQNIVSIADNDPDKWGKEYAFYGYTAPIISAADLVSRINSNDIILITTYYFPDIIAQLDDIEALDKIDCFILQYADEYCDDHITADIKEKIARSKEKEPQIPKKIYYCWFGGGEIPDKLRECINSWSRYCPDYEIFRVDESTYDVAKNRQVKSAYEAGRWSKVSNYARFDIIYENGGIYMDTDVELLKSLDDLLYHQAVIGFSSKRRLEPGTLLGAKKQNALIRMLLECLEENEPYSDECQKRCSKKFYATLCSLGFIPNNTFQSINGMAFYPNDFFCPINQVTGVLKITESTYMIHKFVKSWNDKFRDNWNKMLEFSSKYESRIIKI